MACRLKARFLGLAGGSPCQPTEAAAATQFTYTRSFSRKSHTRQSIMKIEPMNKTLELGDKKVDSASLAEVCRRYGVKELSLFGSAVRGEMRPESDLDIIVEFEPGVRVGLIKFESLIEELEALAGRRIDLVTKRGLKPWVRPEVFKDARIIYKA